MRDYSFGNFISALRERQGLSQYQLGALVGVSDKAVSKWENGASIPRIGTIKKLSEVLDVSVDELLTCEYATFEKERKDLFAMKNEILNIAKNKMKELYGDNPPVKILNRFKIEELILKDHEMLLWMGFFGELQKEFCEKDSYFGIRGAQMGASFIAWLLGGTNVNPLPAHYYCPVCKRVEFVKDEKNGIDLPHKKCFCGENYKRDGFEISEMNMYPLNNYNEIYISENSTEHVKKCLKEYFEGYGVIRILNILSDNRDYSKPEEPFKITRFALFSNELGKKYPEEIVDIQIESYHELIREQSILMTIENKNEKISLNDVMNLDINEQNLKAYFRYAVENGNFVKEYFEFTLEKLYQTLETPKFNDLLSIYGFLHGTNVWKDNAELLFDKGIPLSEMIYCREDVYAYIYDKLNIKCCDNPSGIAFEIKEKVQKGRYSGSKGMPTEIEQLLLKNDVPEWYVESMKKIRYLFPKTHLIVNIKRDICEFLKN